MDSISKQRVIKIEQKAIDEASEMLVLYESLNIDDRVLIGIYQNVIKRSQRAISEINNMMEL